MKRSLFIFTEYFPFGKGETFLETEIEYLATSFDRVIVFPKYQKGTIRIIPDNVEVEYIFKTSQQTSKSNLYLWGLYFVFKQFILIKKIRLNRYFHILGFFKSIKYMGLINCYKTDIQKYFTHSKFSFETAVFYTYWLGYTTIALGLLKTEFPALKIVSRIHGYDLYAERGEKALMFIQYSNLLLLNRLFAVSEHGINYLFKKYPEFKSKFILARLGTRDPGFKIDTSDRHAFILISCSSISAVKRIERIIQVLNNFSKKHPDIHVEWHHIGDGKLKEQITSLAAQFISGNIHYHLHGHIPHNQIFNLYRKLQPDLFINLSESEGLPVSMMEAQSIGLPVMATNVGGVSEIVDNENGILLPANSTITEIVDSLYKNLNYTFIRNKSEKSYENWKAKFQAGKNYPGFIEQLFFNENPYNL